MEDIKGNFDASIVDGKGTRLGVIFRNEFGEVMAAATKSLPTCVEVHIYILLKQWRLDGLLNLLVT